jgi:hypothetical protein
MNATVEKVSLDPIDIGWLGPKNKPGSRQECLAMLVE